MAVLSSAETIDQLKAQYPGGVTYGPKSLNYNRQSLLRNTGFFGSANIVWLTSDSAIEFEAPGCVAAPFVNMLAKKSVSLGMKGQGARPFPVRLYAPKSLSITTNNLRIGDLQILEEPKNASVFCRKLTLSRLTDENRDCIALVQSWIVPDDVELQILHRE